MNGSTHETPPGPGTGRIIGGIALMTVWALAHVVLFYLFFASGAVIDVILVIAKSVLFPGTSARPMGAHTMFGWTGFLQAGLFIAAAAGVPAGLALFQQARRKVWWRGFWILLIGGGMLELHAIYILVTNAFTVPA